MDDLNRLYWNELSAALLKAAGDGDADFVERIKAALASRRKPGPALRNALYEAADELLTGAADRDSDRTDAAIIIARALGQNEESAKARRASPSFVAELDAGLKELIALCHPDKLTQQPLSEAKVRAAADRMTSMIQELRKLLKEADS